MKNICECESRTCHEVPQVRSDSECCKLNIKETNNSVTLELNKLILIKEISFQSIHYFLSPTSNYNLTNDSKTYPNHCKPPSDLPILISTLLI